MACYDYACDKCGHTQIDVFEPMAGLSRPCPHCQTLMVRAWLTKPPTVIGDECDVTIKHGICHEDGSPRRYTSKAEMAREAARKGLTNRVEHVGSAGGDRSPHTSRWF